MMIEEVTSSAQGLGDSFSSVFSALGQWNVAGVSLIVWIIGFLLIGIVGILVRGNK